MDQTWLNYEKQRFIEYILYQYDFKATESVWILNLLKSNPIYLSNISFIKTVNHDRVLSISTKDSNQLPLLYCKNQFCIDDGRQIFHDIRLDQSHIHVLLYLNKRDDRLNRICLLQKLVEYFNKDGQTQFLSQYRNHLTMDHWEQMIRSEIDKALDNNDQKTFLEMTKIMQYIIELGEH
ncbi:YpiB family protein [Mammaliicoccus stepanovicii]|uniref:Putative cytosolic protein n=1 Tax=Mammaliicoccus stepanovicii TaxID=643214 RepID=A0A239Z9E1_9STAP|nr:YpiB family protein [Mammaliicoccus stepanovicii]PNZ72666.1 IDEAL domain-containing protein [Mammaliicoccus stepanovicii]GGI39844.1 UPF0302 protein [Mammaliicoccus stepanovicii]SNV67510.1 Putative cytosolic protein [Mammaliicoccus stepanovicii]